MYSFLWRKSYFICYFLIPLVTNKWGKLNYLLAEGKEIRIIFSLYVYKVIQFFKILLEKLYLNTLKQTNKTKKLWLFKDNSLNTTKYFASKQAFSLNRNINSCTSVLHPSKPHRKDAIRFFNNMNLSPVGGSFSPTNFSEVWNLYGMGYYLKCNSHLASEVFRHMREDRIF